MWKRIALVLAGSLLLIPFAVFADNVGVVSATIDFDAVVNMLIDQDWDGITIDQPWIDNLFTSGATMPVAWGAGATEPWNIEVTVQALSQYNVYAGYSSTTTNFATLVGSVNAFIALEDQVLATTLDIKYVAALPTFTGLSTPGPDTGTHSETDAAVGAAFTLLGGWSGLNNLPTGETRTYDVWWYPTELTGDFGLTNNDQLLIDIYFLVTDPTV